VLPTQLNSNSFKDHSESRDTYIPSFDEETGVIVGQHIHLLQIAPGS
jgi:hypothetical protein